MKWVPDKTGRFPQRPHYQPEEIDFQCERLVQKFLLKRYGKVEFPLTTEDITILIEERADLDSCVDLSHEDGEVDGVTDFLPGQRPLVRISDTLSASYMENRLRTTLTHEFGHVYFHQSMFQTIGQTGSLFPTEQKGHTNRCKRANIEGASETDWMEWQAGYACGALLIPAGALVAVVQGFRTANGVPYSELTVGSEPGRQLINLVSGAFQTSKEAARVRLLKKGHVSDAAATAGLF